MPLFCEGFSERGGGFWGKCQQKISGETTVAQFWLAGPQFAHCSLTGTAECLVCFRLKDMKQAYRLFRRGEVFCLQNNSTGEQKSLRTKNEKEAKRLFEVHNSTKHGTALNLELGKVYLRAADPMLG